MALNFSHFPLSLTSKISQLPSSRSHSFLPCTIAGSSSVAASSATNMSSGRPRVKDFPYASPPIKDLMVDLVSTIENRLESMLLPCTLPQDVQYFQNQSDTAHASLLLRSGVPSSPIDFILSSWLHCKLPTGGALNITSLSSYMNDSSDAPHLAIEIIQSSPTNLVLILDLPPRKDLILNPDYLNIFYEDTQLENQRQLLDNLPEFQAYVSTSLFIRSVFSPTAVLHRLDTSSSGEARLEQILRDEVMSAAKQVVRIWLERCVFGEKQDVSEFEKDLLKKRDRIYRSKSIETHIGSALPEMFGQEIADRVLEVLLAASL
ncbi:red chlorophyll catabolite reductase, chloroplastic-like [Amaranthus tricolor]|uniref:Red chlorophyll catabolite reductase n=1 Tax=Amaranthus tricolor TaxID=29722 RepID=A0A221C730_AMATR|nr:red chlorophyll catabolite reductase, chloroplastic-like [Amaranthus tricolor]ASL68831.1 red chlorophyll catabolite reductase [Amaranthus tricolor]